MKKVEDTIQENTELSKEELQARREKLTEFYKNNLPTIASLTLQVLKVYLINLNQSILGYPDFLVTCCRDFYW